ncbi:MAG: lipopolysaccharide kinase InaA family protein [Desulfatiglandales bacterium]
MTKDQDQEGNPGEKIVIYPSRNVWKARVTLKNGSIVKDYGSSPLMPKIFGRLCIRWEEAALKRLEGFEGIPLLQGRPTPYSLRLQALPGVPLAELKKGDLTEAFLDRLISLFERMHAAGVAHGDAHQRNILMHDQRPYLIDFSTSRVKGRWPLISDYIFDRFVLLDLQRIYKVRKKFFEDRDPPKMFWLYRLVRRFK